MIFAIIIGLIVGIPIGLWVAFFLVRHQVKLPW